MFLFCLLILSRKLMSTKLTRQITNYSSRVRHRRMVAFTIENTLYFIIRTGADLHSVRTRYRKYHVCSMQFSVCGKFRDSCKKSINCHVKNSFWQCQLSKSVKNIFAAKVISLPSERCTNSYCFYRSISYSY